MTDTKTAPTLQDVRKESSPMATATTYPCMYCHRAVTFGYRQGWIHVDGGAYVMRCPDCGWEDSPIENLIDCPNCGGRKLRDDHHALARRS